jgi:hypothetical protein
VGLGSAAADLVPGDLAQAWHRRIRLKRRFLLSDREHRTQVLRGRRNLLRGKRRVDVRGPALAIGCLGREQTHDLCLDLVRLAGRRFLSALGTATGQDQQCRDAHDQSIGLHGAPSKSVEPG